MEFFKKLILTYHLENGKEYVKEYKNNINNLEIKNLKVNI